MLIAARFCLLCSRKGDRALAIRFRFRRIRLRRLECDFTGDTIEFGLESSFLCCFYRCHGFADATPSRIELAKLGMGQPPNMIAIDEKE
jgi:hypothetical protein